MRIVHTIESWLYARDFTNPEVRRLVSWQIVLAGGTSLLALALSGTNPAGWSFAVGALLVTVNFYHLARFVQQIVHVRNGAVIASLIRFYFRLILAGVVLYVLIAWAGAHVAALLAGLTTVPATALAYAAGRLAGKNVKEA